MTRGSVSLSCATTPSLPAFLNLNGSNNQKLKNSTVIKVMLFGTIELGLLVKLCWLLGAFSDSGKEAMNI